MRIAILSILVLTALAFGQEKYAGRKLIGYVPIYNSGAPVYTLEQNIRKTDFSKLTHVIIAFVFSDSLGNISYYGNHHSGAWSPQNTVDSIIAIARRNDTKVLISLGSDLPGWKMTLKPETRTNFVRNIKQLMIDKGLDGLDLDLEGGWGDDAPFYYREYELLAQELRDSLDGEFYLTAAIGFSDKSWDGKQLWTEGFVQLMDWVNIMVYDIHLWLPTAVQNPSGMQDQINAANLWGRFLPREKLVFGVPFYSNGWNFDNDRRYAIEICWWLPTCTETSNWFPFDVFNYFVLDSLFDLAPDQDSILVTQNDKLWINVAGSTIGYRGSHNGIIYLNNRTLLKNKAKWAIENGYGGMMIWETGGDVPTNHPRSLLRALAEQFKESTGEPAAILPKQAASSQNNFTFSLQNRTLKINLENANSAEIKIIDSKGKVLYRTNQNTKSISLNLARKQFSSGVYFLQVLQNGKAKSAKFVLR